MLELFLYFGIGAAIGYLTVIALRVTAWIIGAVVSAIAGLIKKIGETIAVVRKKKARKKFLEAMSKVAEQTAAQQDKAAIQEAFNDLMGIEDEAFVVPLNSEGKEDWTKVKIVKADDNEQDDMEDTVVITHDGRCRSLRQQ